MYDVYRHAFKKQFELTVLQGAKLPEKALSAEWLLLANRKLVPKIVRDEIGRIGYCVTRPRKQIA
jgi:hypothetical protein